MRMLSLFRKARCGGTRPFARTVAYKLSDEEMAALIEETPTVEKSRRVWAVVYKSAVAIVHKIQCP